MSENCFLYPECNHVDCEVFCLRKYKLENLYNNALISKTQRVRIALSPDDDGTDLDKFRQLAAIEKDITTFIEQGKNLYLYSINSGNGKTSWALRLAQAYLNDVWPEKESTSAPVLFISVPRYLLALKANISAKNDYITHINKYILDADVVIWDDIFHKATSEFEYNQLLAMIETRISMGKSNLYTSNISPETTQMLTDSRLTSRVINLSTVIELTGADKRQLTVK